MLLTNKHVFINNAIIRKRADCENILNCDWVRRVDC